MDDLAPRPREGKGARDLQGGTGQLTLPPLSALAIPPLPACGLISRALVVKGWAMHQLDSCQRQPSKAGRLGCVFGLAANVGERILLQHGKAVQPQLLKEATDVVESLCLDLKVAALSPQHSKATSQTLRTCMEVDARLSTIAARCNHLPSPGLSSCSVVFSACLQSPQALDIYFGAVRIVLLIHHVECTGWPSKILA